MGDTHALGGAGKLHLRKGNLDLARRCLTTALASLAGDCGEAAVQNRLLGQVLRRQGDYFGAAEAFSRVVSSDCAKDEDYLWLSRCYELGPKDVSRSCGIISVALSRYEASGACPPQSLVKRLRRLEKRRSKSER